MAVAQNQLQPCITALVGCIHGGKCRIDLTTDSMRLDNLPVPTTGLLVKQSLHRLI